MKKNKMNEDDLPAYKEAIKKVWRLLEELEIGGEFGMAILEGVICNLRADEMGLYPEDKKKFLDEEK